MPEEEKGGPDLFHGQRERLLYQQVSEKDAKSVLNFYNGRFLNKSSHNRVLG